MELHDENTFKIRSYANAYINLRKLDTPLASLSMDELQTLKGVGEAIAEKIQSLVKTGKMPTLEKYLAKTPPGVVEMLKINGLGPKKIATLWKEYGFESPGELLYACNENRLVDLKGFGAKSQASIAQAIEFLESSTGLFSISTIESQGTEILNQIKAKYPASINKITGDGNRGVQEMKHIEILSSLHKSELKTVFTDEDFEWVESAKHSGIWKENVPVIFYYSETSDWTKQLYITTGPPDFSIKYPWHDHFKKDEDLFTYYNLPYLTEELRDVENIDQKSRQHIHSLIKSTDIRGTIHNHSTYSDGIHTVEEMADAAKSMGYEYMVITDHSQASALAHGLTVEALQNQWSEIDQLNKKYTDFKVLKGIECDILSKGELDYEDEILKQFDLVIASIHIAFQMDIEKATQRMIKAIENPYTNIIGHPTGRLILSREGYPLDVPKILDACKANQVAIELNANPQRLDLDYKYLKMCMEKEVMVAINPDAHNRSAIKDIRYGIIAARKGLLEKKWCLNTFTVNDLLTFCSKK